MSNRNKNYNRMFDANKFENPEEVVMETAEEIEDEATEVEEVVLEEAASEIVSEEASGEVGPIPFTGKVVKCSKLNIRNRPSKDDSVVVDTVTVGSELTVYNPETHGGWYDVCTSSGIRGFCMKEYIKVN